MFQKNYLKFKTQTYDLYTFLNVLILIFLVFPLFTSLIIIYSFLNNLPWFFWWIARFVCKNIETWRKWKKKVSFVGLFTEIKHTFRLYN